MTKNTDSSSTIEIGATAVITHRVLDGQQAEYEDWLNEIGPVCRSYAHLDLQIIRPIAGLTTTYTVIIRFDTHEHLEKWMGSRDRKRLIEKARPLLAKDDDFFHSQRPGFLVHARRRESHGAFTMETVSRYLIRHLPLGPRCAAASRTASASTGAAPESLP